MSNYRSLTVMEEPKNLTAFAPLVTVRGARTRLAFDPVNDLYKSIRCRNWPSIILLIFTKVIYFAGNKSSSSSQTI